MDWFGISFIQVNALFDVAIVVFSILLPIPMFFAIVRPIFAIVRVLHIFFLFEGGSKTGVFHFELFFFFVDWFFSAIAAVLDVLLLGSFRSHHIQHLYVWRCFPFWPHLASELNRKIPSYLSLSMQTVKLNDIEMRVFFMCSNPAWISDRFVKSARRGKPWRIVACQDRIHSIHTHTVHWKFYESVQLILLCVQYTKHWEHYILKVHIPNCVFHCLLESFEFQLKTIGASSKHTRHTNTHTNEHKKYK